MQKQESNEGQGFLITCDKNKQKLAVRDATNFLTQFIEEIYGDIETQIIHKQLQARGKQFDLKNEMQVRATLKNKIKILSAVETNVNCLAFIKINNNQCPVKIDPYKVVNQIMKAVHQQGRQVTRFCHKIMPVQKSFKAEHFKMLDEIDSMFQKRDNSQMKSWALNFKCRNNSKFNYKQVLGKTQQIAKKYGHFVDIYYPQWTVSVEIVNHLMCLSIVQKFKQCQEFRLHKKNMPKPQKQKNETHPKTSKQEVMKLKRQEKNLEKAQQIIKTGQSDKDEVSQNKNSILNCAHEKLEQKSIQGKLLSEKIQLKDDDEQFI